MMVGLNAPSNRPGATPTRRRGHRARALLAGLATLALAATGTVAAQAEGFTDSEQAVLSYSPASTNAFVGSPTLEVLDDGTYVAASTRFGGGAEAFGSGGKRFTEVLRSTDRGTTWTRTAVVEPMFWATIFELDGSLYLMGNGSADEYDDIVLSRSTDAGLTWSTPTVLRQGTYTTGDTPVAIANGRVYKSFERYLGGGWGNFRALVISAPLDADLTDPASWTTTNEGTTNLVLEGNTVVDRTGRVLDIQRWHDHPTQTMWEQISPDGTQLNELGAVTWPRGVSINKFYILWDEPSQRYLMVGNPETEDKFSGLAHHRNVLSLYESPDLTDWQFVTNLVLDDQRQTWEQSVRTTAFSQPTIQVDGDDLLLVSRTGYQGSNTNHNTNQMTFHRFPDFRTWLGHGSEVLHLGFDDAGDPGVDTSASAGIEAESVVGTVVADGKFASAFTPGAGGMDLGNQVHPTLWGARGLTMAAWTRAISPIPQNGVIFQSAVNGSTTGAEISLRAPAKGVGAQMRAEVRATRTTPAVVRTVAYPDDGAWHHVAAVADLAGNTMRIYIDGTEVDPQGAAVSFGSDEYKVSNPTVHDRVGSATFGATLTGTVDDLRLFRTALPAGDVAALADAQMPAPTGISANGTPLAFTPTADVQTLTVEPGTTHLTVGTDEGTTASPSSTDVRLAAGETQIVNLDLTRGGATRHMTLRVRAAAAAESSTDVTGIFFSGAAPLNPSAGADEYHLSVGALPGVTPAALSVTQVVPRSPRASATVLEQPDMSAEAPRARVRITAQDGTTRDITVHVDIVRDTLVGHWTFDEEQCCTWKDSSPFARTATGTGTPSAGPRGGAVTLDGKSRVVLGNTLDEALSGAPAVTLAGWIRPTALAQTGENNVIFGTRVNAKAAGMDVLFDGTNLRVAGRSTGSDSYQKALFPYPQDGQWHHIAATLDYAAKKVRLSIDGTPVTALPGADPVWASTSYRPGTPADPSTLGGSPSSGLFLTGSLDDMRIYGRALSAAETTELATTDLPTVTAETQPEAPGKSGWFTTTPSLSFRTTPSVGAGKITVTHSVDGGEARTQDVREDHTTPAVTLGEGRHTVTYHVSRGGSDGPAQSLEMAVDTTAPQVSATVTKEDAGSRVTLDAQDATSGVASLQCAVEDGEWTDCADGVVVTTVGATTVHYRATDTAGNTSTVGEVSVVVEKAPDPGTDPGTGPTPTPTPDPGTGTGGGGNGSGTTPSAAPAPGNSAGSPAAGGSLAITGAALPTVTLLGILLLSGAALLVIRRSRR